MKRWNDVLSVKRRLRGVGSRRRSRNNKEKPGMYLASVRMTVPAHPDLLSPGMRVAVVEDLLWSVESEQWAKHRPFVWRRKARAAWRAEGAALSAKRERIQALVKD